MPDPEFPQTRPLSPEEESQFEEVRDSFILSVAEDHTTEIDVFMDDWATGSGHAAEKSFYDLLAFMKEKFNLSEEEAVEAIIAHQYLKLEERRRGSKT